eukprot:979-Heterococcus_DN1.PRE.1
MVAAQQRAQLHIVLVTRGSSSRGERACGEQLLEQATVSPSMMLIPQSVPIMQHDNVLISVH